jgi:hypothetical protein
MDIRRAARIGAWTVAGGAVLAIALYGLLVAINWSDEKPSADALKLQRMLDRPAVPDTANGYVLALGLAAPQAQDPVALGQARKQFLAGLKPSIEQFAVLPGEDVDYRASRPETISALANACKKGDEACLRQVRQNPEQVVQWLASEAWLLERYLGLVRLQQWQDTIPKGLNAPFPKYGLVLDGQQLLLMRAWQLACDADGDAARELLQQDLAFWRMVLRSTDMLITKMIAVAAIDRNFSVGNLALRELHGAGADATPPALWKIPISPEERSMRQALAGEWLLMAAALDSLLGPGVDLGQLLDTSVSDRLMRPMVKLQATKNLQAARMFRLASGLDVDFRGLPSAIHAMEQASTTGKDWFHLYNPVGNIVDQAGEDNGYIGYAVRASDLEGTRRAALLAAELRAGSTAATDPLDRVRTTTLRNPYTDAPLQWDAATRSIVFVGLEPGPRSRHAMPL